MEIQHPVHTLLQIVTLKNLSYRMTTAKLFNLTSHKTSRTNNAKFACVKSIEFHTMYRTNHPYMGKNGYTG